MSSLMLTMIIIQIIAYIFWTIMFLSFLKKAITKTQMEFQSCEIIDQKAFNQAIIRNMDFDFVVMMFTFVPIINILTGSVCLLYVLMNFIDEGSYMTILYKYKFIRNMFNIDSTILPDTIIINSDNSLNKDKKGNVTLANTNIQGQVSLTKDIQ